MSCCCSLARSLSLSPQVLLGSVCKGWREMNYPKAGISLFFGVLVGGADCPVRTFDVTGCVMVCGSEFNAFLAHPYNQERGG